MSTIHEPSQVLDPWDAGTVKPAVVKSLRLVIQKQAQDLDRIREAANAVTGKDDQDPLAAFANVLGQSGIMSANLIAVIREIAGDAKFGRHARGNVWSDATKEIIGDLCD